MISLNKLYNNIYNDIQVKQKGFKVKKFFSVIDWKLIFIILLPVWFYILVRFFVTYSPHSICIFKNLTGHDCWGCGMTRAFNALFKLDFTAAYNFNPRIVILAPLMLYIWLETLIKYIRRKNNNTLNKVTNR